MEREPKPGDVRVIGGISAHDTKIEVWCGEPHGWVMLRGVTAVSWGVLARSPEPRLSQMILTINPLFSGYFSAMSSAEQVALRLVGVSDEMVEAAREAVAARRKELS